MMLIVNNLYKKEAKLINEQYYETVNNLLKKQEELSTYKNSLENIINNIDIKKNNITVNEVESLMIKLDKDYNIMKLKLKPYLDKIEELKKRSEILYTTLKENYPGYTDSEISKALTIE